MIDDEEKNKMIVEEKLPEAKKVIEILKKKNECNKIIILLILIMSANILTFIKNNKTMNLSRVASLKKSINYMKKCHKGLFINKNHMNFSPNPKISVVIPVYNCQNTIKFAVRSIQNQDMADIEIMLVNDFSKDKTPTIIQELSEEDPRIKIINNKKNMGTLYTRNIGILQSEGKYIMNLDNDDLFMDQDVFDVTYNEAEYGNFDIIGFTAVECDDYKPAVKSIFDSPFHIQKNGLIVRQPELMYFPYSKDNNTFYPNDYHVWGRLVRSDIYKKTINNFGTSILGQQRNTSFLLWTEDISITIPLFYYSKSYKYIKKYGVFHFLSTNTATFTIPNDHRLFSELFFLDVMFDFTENNFKGKKFIVEKVRLIKGYYHFSLKNEKNVLYLKKLLQKVMNCQYISDEDKKIIKNEYISYGLFDD